MDQNIHIQQHIQRIYISTFFILCIKQRLVKSCLCHSCVPVNIKSFGNQYGFQLIRHRTIIRSYKHITADMLLPFNSINIKRQTEFLHLTGNYLISPPYMYRYVIYRQIHLAFPFFYIAGCLFIKF